MGSSTSASSVICHEKLSITANVSISVTALPTTLDSVSLKARCAPITSLFRRLTSAPVRVRVKNATGMRCTWSKTAVRRCEDQPLTDAGGEQSRHQTQPGLGEGDHGDQYGEPDHDAAVGAVDDRVDHPTGETGVPPP